MGQVARTRAGERFSSRRLVAEMGGLYAELAGAAPYAPPRWRRVRSRTETGRGGATIARGAWPGGPTTSLPEKGR